MQLQLVRPNYCASIDSGPPTEPTLGRQKGGGSSPLSPMLATPLVQWLEPHPLETSKSSAVNGFLHAIHKHSKKCFAHKVAHFDSPGRVPMIEAPFNSSCVALQYETRTKFSH